jgi:hypothetical protein
MKEIDFSFRDDKVNTQMDMTNELPFNTSTRSFETPINQLIPKNTRVSRVWTNEDLNSCPFYERYWPLDGAKKVIPDVSKDPRYDVKIGENLSGYKALK